MARASDKHLEAVAAMPQVPGGQLSGDRPSGDHGHGAPVLGIALFGIAQCHGTFLAIGDRGYSVALHALRDQEFARGGGPAGGQGDSVFARAALIRVAFDLDGDIGILLEPGGLAPERFKRSAWVLIHRRACYHLRMCC